jgi:hypothetical protein
MAGIKHGWDKAEVTKSSRAKLRIFFMQRSAKLAGTTALGLLAFFLPGSAIRAQNKTQGRPIISAYGRSDEGPGKMQLLPQYVAGLPQGETCVDTVCGYIWNPRGLTIDYDIGGMAGVRLGPAPPEGIAEYFFWYGEASINGQRVRYAVSGGDKPASMSISFPESSANFNADIRNEGEIQTVLQMVLTYQGVGYRPSAEGAVDGRVVLRDGTPLEGIDVNLGHPPEGKATRTDDKGHFRFLGLAPGRYNLIARNTRRRECDFPPQRWRIRVDPAQIQLRSFVVRCQ